MLDVRCLVFAVGTRLVNRLAHRNAGMPEDNVNVVLVLKVLYKMVDIFKACLPAGRPKWAASQSGQPYRYLYIYYIYIYIYIYHTYTILCSIHSALIIGQPIRARQPMRGQAGQEGPGGPGGQAEG